MREFSETKGERALIACAWKLGCFLDWIRTRYWELYDRVRHAWRKRRQKSRINDSEGRMTPDGR